MAEIPPIVVRFLGDITQLSASMVGAQAEIEKFAGQTQSLMSKYSGAFTVAALIVSVASLKMAADFESAMMLIHTQAGASIAEINQYGPAILKMAGQVGQSPKALADALFYIRSAGIQGGQALDTLRVAAEGAAVGHANLTDTASALTSVLKSGIGGIQDSTDAMGQMNAVVGAGKMKMQDLDNALKTGILATAKNFGVDFKSLGAALDVLTINGVPAEAAATRLRMGISMMGAPSIISAKALTTLGLSTDEVQTSISGMAALLQKTGVHTTQLADDLRQPNGLFVALSDLKKHMTDAGLSADEQAAVITRAFGGARMGDAVRTLFVNLDQLKDRFQTVTTNASNFEQAWKDTQTTFSQLWKEMWATVEAFAIKFGNVILPLAKTLGHGFLDFFNLIKDNQGVIDALVAVVSGLLVRFVAIKTLQVFEFLYTGAKNLAIQIGTLVGNVLGFGTTATTEMQAIDSEISFTELELQILGGGFAEVGVQAEAAGAEAVGAMRGAGTAAEEAGAQADAAKASFSGLGTIIGLVATAGIFMWTQAQENLGKGQEAGKKALDSFMAGKPSIDEMKSHLEELNQRLNDLNKTGPASADIFGRTWDLMFGHGSREARDLKTQIGGVQGALKAAADDQKTYDTNMDEVSRLTGLGTDQIEKLANSMGIDLHKASADQINQLIDLSGIVQSTTGDVGKMDDKYVLIAADTAVLASNTSSAADKVKALKDAFKSLIDENVALNDAHGKWLQDLRNLQTNVDATSRSLDINTDAGFKNQQAIENLIGDAETYALNQYQANLKTMDAKTAHDQLVVSLQNAVKQIDDNTTRVGFNKQAVDNLLTSLGVYDTTKWAASMTFDDSQAIAALQTLDAATIAALRNIDQAINNTEAHFASFLRGVESSILPVGPQTQPQTQGVGSLGPQLLPQAEGGLITAPEIALIGEAGPELILPLTNPGRMAELLSSSGLIKPFNQSPSISATLGGGGGDNITIVVNPPIGSNPKQIADMVLDALYRRKRNNRSSSITNSGVGLNLG